MVSWVRGATLVLLAGACGGQSLSTDDGGAGGAGTGGSAGSGGSVGGSSATGGAGGKGGSGATGGSVGGSSATGGAGGKGGSGATGGAVGGSGALGGAAGVSGVGGSMAGTSGAAGAGGACAQPLVTGSCNAYFERYGFNVMTGHCEKFAYGGCGANENNFETLGDCEAACGGSTEGGCPELEPAAGEACMSPGHPCHYDLFSHCLCARNTPDGYSCPRVDPQCTGPLRDALPPEDGGDCGGEGCVPVIRVPLPTTCDCVGAAWVCTAGG